MNLVFLHGINNTGRAYDAIRGHLPTDWASDAPDLPALDRVEEIAGALLPDLPDSFVLVGHSFGGYVALALLDAVPDRIKGLILINSSTGADTTAAAITREDRARDAENGLYEKLAESATAITYHADSLDKAVLMDARARDVAQYGAKRYSAHQRACAARPDRTALTAGWDGPKLLLSAAEDKVITLPAQTAKARNIGAQQEVFDGTGHMIIVEAPDAVAGFILNWCTKTLLANLSNNPER